MFSRILCAIFSVFIIQVISENGNFAHVYHKIFEQDAPPHTFYTPKMSTLFQKKRTVTVLH